ncbi:heavy-metal-associated domain-containing protein [Bacteroides sp.]|uniref:heavy-metal-associated domain-containing protein n=1 Tax=Bacteroides sp. TaxID=29523 RepID=UPI001B7268ED|nr:heavy-metal-associated domain-containing protein [Bacteroides sp.]MBP6065677.1 cation transporter [Bacteroides sp.]MBP6068032.1 cation transporter [Bacteroides sp.]MBP6936843.1 cation transporter [Bacteroides sp.]MBP8622286.1 cation transporter [Bacteroides sp.]MBP9506904.1 cation transporter [Bacteroides sp.]
MKTKKMLATLIVALLSVTAVMAKDFRTVVFKVEQMECPNCERKVKNNIKYEKGLKEFSTDVKSQTVTITYDAKKTDVKKLQAGFKKFKYDAVVLKEAQAVETKN